MNQVCTAPKKTTPQTKLNIGVITPFVTANNAPLVCEALEAACSLGFKVSVLAEGDLEGQKACFVCSEKYPKNFSMLENMGENRTKVLDKSDVVILSHAPTKAEFAEIASLGVIPILPDNCGIPNFDSKTEEGCAFTYNPENIWSLVAALVRASENRKFSWDWKTVKQNLEDFAR